MTQTADLPIPPDQNPLAGEVNALWAKILDEEIIHGGPLTSSHIDEAKSVVNLHVAHGHKPDAAAEGCDDEVGSVVG